MELTCLVYKEINFDPAIKQVLGNDWTDHHIGLHLPQDQQDLQDLLHTVQEVLRVGDTPGTGESLKYLYMMFSNFFSFYAGQLHEPRISSEISPSFLFQFTNLIASCPQIIFCLGLVMIQCFVVLLWITLDNPEVEDVYCIRRHVKVCKSNAFHMSLAEVYNVILAIVATLYAFLVRNVDQGGNSTRSRHFSGCSALGSFQI